MGILAPGNRPGELEWARLPTTSALAQHGWIAGRTLDIEFAYTQGREGQLAQLAQELEEGKNEGLQPIEMAELLAQVGETARALDWLEKA